MLPGDDVYGGNVTYCRSECKVNARCDDDGDVYIMLGKHPLQFEIVCNKSTAMRLASTIMQCLFDKEHPGPNGETAERLAQTEQTA